MDNVVAELNAISKEQTAETTRQGVIEVHLSNGRVYRLSATKAEYHVGRQMLGLPFAVLVLDDGSEAMVRSELINEYVFLKQRESDSET